MLLFIYLGGVIYIMKEFHGRDLLQIIDREKVTFFHATAAIYNIMLQVKDREQFNLRHLKMALCGGSPISISTIKMLTEWLPWLDFRTVYGLTESSSPTTAYFAFSGIVERKKLKKLRKKKEKFSQ
jgi:long-chain acyl-CoA synthetase